MNSALQILCHTPEVVEYFLSGKYEEVKGEYNLESTACNELQLIIENIQNGTDEVFNPSAFKNNVKDDLEFLRDRSQHDAIEFFTRLLNLIDDELTGKKTKSENEHDSNFPCVSIVSRTIEGSKGREMRCNGGCNEVYQQSDNFITLPVHIPSKSQITVNIKYYPSVPKNGKAVIQYKMKSIDEKMNLNDLMNQILPSVNTKIIKPFVLIHSEKILKNIISNDEKVLNLIDHQEKNSIHLYDLKELENNEKYYNFEICSEDESSSFDNSIFKFAIDQKSTLEEFYLVVCNYLFQEDVLDYSEVDQRQPDFKISMLYKTQSKDKLCLDEVPKSNSTTLEEFINQKYPTACSFKIKGLKGKNSQLFKKDIFRENLSNKNEITLEECLKSLSEKEVYSDFECDKCGISTDSIHETKITSLPNYLVIQLVRFKPNNGEEEGFIKKICDFLISSKEDRQNNFYSKKDDFVKYPLKGLDLREYCIEKIIGDCIYDLYGVIHHSGSESSGHYWATIKNDINSDQWFKFNDSQVTKCDEQDVVSYTGYALFYCKRDRMSRY